MRNHVNLENGEHLSILSGVYQWQTHDTDVLRDPREYDWIDESRRPGTLGLQSVSSISRGTCTF